MMMYLIQCTLEIIINIFGLDSIDIGNVNDVMSSLLPYLRQIIHVCKEKAFVP